MDVGHQSPIPSFVKFLEKNQNPSTAIKRGNEWNMSQLVEEEISIRAGGATFTLKKFPLIAKCGYIRKLLAESSISKNLLLYEIPDIPGGAEGFELAVRFCNGVELEIDSNNIATLRCVAEFLEMTEEYATGNLIAATEDHLKEVTLKNLHSCIVVLHHSEGLLPMAEKVNLVSRCMDAVARIACSDGRYCLPSRKESDKGGAPRSPLLSQPKAGFADWWAEDLTVLGIDTFKKVILAMKSNGFKQYALGTVLMLYAQKSLRGLDRVGRGRKKIEPEKEHEKRVVLETIVGILPDGKNAMSVSFLSMLLRTAVYLETTVACRLDLEKRIGMQLGQAVLDDLLITSPFSFSGDTMFDVDSVQRILINYLEYEEASGDLNTMCYNTDDDYVLPSPGDMERVGKLMETYLSEIASDENLSISKFVGLAELIPEQARITEDGMYRAIDIYIKAHPSLNETERKKVCSVMDCQRLSREACAHAAQNERLPVQVVVQVLYYEQQRLCDATNGGGSQAVGSPFPPKTVSMSSPRPATHPHDHELARLRRENDNLRHELRKVKMIQNDKSIGQDIAATAEKPPIPKKSIINSVSKKLGWFNPFVHLDSLKSPSLKARSKPPKDRRHSVS